MYILTESKEFSNYGKEVRQEVFCKLFLFYGIILLKFQNFCP